MTPQKLKILESVKTIKKFIPVKFKPKLALITERNYTLPYGINVLKKVEMKDLPLTYQKTDTIHTGTIYFTRVGGRDLIVLKGRFHFYDGYTMRDIGHIIYILSRLGVEKILSIDEVAMLNPRFEIGNPVLVYDHINLMGDNPLIGENDDELGLRFPDMSNAYDKKIYEKIYNVFKENKMDIFQAVYLGLTGPQTETEAEARFYREIGADILGYSITPENITAVHAGVRFVSICLITRDLIADKMLYDNRSEQEKISEESSNRRAAQAELNKILIKILKTL